MGDHYVNANHACTACAAGKSNAAGDDPSSDATSCAAIVCAENQHVASNACVDCATGTSNAAGDDASGVDTSCTATATGVDLNGVRSQQSAAPTVVPAIGLVAGMLAALQLWV